MSNSSRIAHDNRRPDPHQPRAARTLVAVRGLSETIAAGYGNAMLAVRTLDDVSLDVRAGELVVLSGRVAEGTASLAAVLAGRRRITHGTRALHPGVRVRRGSVSSTVQQAIIDGWAAGRGGALPANDASRTPTAYVLRVRGEPTGVAYAVGSVDAAAAGCQRCWADTRGAEKRGASYPAGSWFGWARALCERGGAIVLWSESRCRCRTCVSTAVHERGEEPTGQYGSVHGAVDSTGRPVRGSHDGRLRAVHLVAGRLVPAATGAHVAVVARASVVEVCEGRE